MYIKRVDLRGFKTFGKKTTVHLDRGLTIISGPNGSGKSNIIDAVKFALGELSPKELRGETISDLVYKGGQTTSSRSAYVAVQFDNNDRRIPIDSENVTISREFRRGGEGIYRLNGRRISRKQLTDILSSADIQVSSHNIVPQHAITRLAEVTAEERRRIIEDMVGIAVYDTKKASAQVELQKADVNLKVGSAKIEEVRLRVESLEKERNDYLKYQQIRTEINQLQAKALSHKIKKAENEIGQLEEKIKENQLKLQELKSKRDELIQQKSKLEKEKREYEDSVAEKGTSKLLEIQTSIGDVNATIARLRAQSEVTESNIKSLEKQKAELQESTIEILQKISDSRKELRQLTSQHAKRLGETENKRLLVDESSKKLTAFREELGDRNKEAEDLDRSINALTHRIIKFNAQIKASATKIDLLQNHIRTLETRKQEYEVLIPDLKKRLDELGQVSKNEETRLSETDAKLIQYAELKVQRKKEVEHAESVWKRARTTLTEIETQRNFAENLASDEKALKIIEEIAQTGAVPGVYGRLGTLVKAKRPHERAVAAASSGWMKALVVKNIEVAVSCIEFLKKAKVGRVKIIPLENLATHESLKVPGGMKDVAGPITGQLQFDQRFRPAVEFVFGDTVLAKNEKSAFLVSLRGIRAVAPTGDIYEPGGGMETGYFRQPLDIAKLLLATGTVDQLRTTLSSLEQLAGKAKEDISRLEQEILDYTKSKAQSQNLIKSSTRETSTFTENVERAQKIVQETGERIDQVTREIGTEQAVLEASASQKDSLQVRLTEFEKTRNSLKLRSKSALLLEMENQHAKLTSDLNEVTRERVEIESRIESLTSAVAVIDPSAEQTKVQISSIDTQIKKFSEDITLTQAELSKFEDQLKQLQANREQLSGELAGVKLKRGEYDAQLNRMDEEITEILEQLDPLTNEMSDLNASHKNLQLQMQYHLNELKELGFSEAMEVSDDGIANVEATLPILKKELSAIGGINELAVSQYEEVSENYKGLASRIYELEKEKLSILQFMNELDQQKLEAFMKAFNQVSESFNEIFSTVTSGVGRLYLDNQEKPFEGGADIRLQFPGKTEMGIGSASGGEKSVGTVCFILALQAIHPMPFYMMDEIDAHLDVVNSQRLAELLKARSRGSQFIIVSLKDVTIARADTVYGVFIQDAVSQIVSLPMQEARAVGRAK